jgi:hypothetical protein
VVSVNGLKAPQRRRTFLQARCEIHQSSEIERNREVKQDATEWHVDILNDCTHAAFSNTHNCLQTQQIEIRKINNMAVDVPYKTV